MFDQMQNINDKDSFIGFLNALSQDFKEHSEEWENIDIPSFLEAMAAWVKDFSECPQNDTDWSTPDYYTLARIIYMGKLYE